jgi:hypothetical protein
MAGVIRGAGAGTGAVDRGDRGDQKTIKPERPPDFRGGRFLHFQPHTTIFLTLIHRDNHIRRRVTTEDNKA